MEFTKNRNVRRQWKRIEKNRKKSVYQRLVVADEEYELISEGSG